MIYRSNTNFVAYTHNRGNTATIMYFFSYVVYLLPEERGIDAKRETHDSVILLKLYYLCINFGSEEVIYILCKQCLRYKLKFSSYTWYTIKKTTNGRNLYVILYSLHVFNVDV